LANNFGFLTSWIYRTLFYVLLASLIWNKGIVGFVAAVIILATAAFNMYILYAFPEYYRCREEIIGEEDRDVERRVREGERGVKMGVRNGEEV
jgi:hypothetical protein